MGEVQSESRRALIVTGEIYLSPLRHNDVPMVLRFWTMRMEKRDYGTLPDIVASWGLVDGSVVGYVEVAVTGGYRE